MNDPKQRQAEGEEPSVKQRPPTPEEVDRLVEYKRTLDAGIHSTATEVRPAWTSRITFDGGSGPFNK